MKPAGREDSPVVPATPPSAPRLVVAGLGGDSGKTLVSLGLLLLARERGLPVGAFKKGPDYIDAAWLTWASGNPARNLDTYLMGFEGVRDSFARHAAGHGLNVIEGNRGLHDGSDSQGTHSTAELAKALGAPVLLVVNAAKVTRTVAAMVLGCREMDPDVSIAGVLLNRVAGKRHERVIREAVEGVCGIPVVGSIPRGPAGALLPGRHLGLVTPQEHPRIGEVARTILDLTRDAFDVEAILAMASGAGSLPAPPDGASAQVDGSGLRIGYLSDSAFTFYYPDNLESLEAAGARLVSLSALSDGAFPQDLHALYMGGGFPETHGSKLSANAAWLDGLRKAAQGGLPIFAECGGLMALCRSILWKGRRFPMAAVFPFDTEVLTAPQGHGYTELAVDRDNPFFSVGSVLKGHEFHYSKVLPSGASPPTACRVVRGTGCFDGRDALLHRNVWAGYTHFHALGTPEWTKSLLSRASHFARSCD